MRARRMLPIMFVAAPLAALAAGDVAEGVEEFGFFDFLGEMVEDEDGEWVDPLAMETLAEDARAESDEYDGQRAAAPGEQDDE